MVRAVCAGAHEDKWHPFAYCCGAKKYLNDNNIETRPIFTPMHKLNMYKNPKKNFVNSTDIYDLGISLPSYPDLKEKEIKFICGKIKKFLNNN